MSNRPASTIQRRLDLQGLRAVAVLLVAFDHAGVPFLTGGYVGVDVFFVLSGFFITQVLLSARADGRTGILAGLGDFYTRRIKRILPAACLTLVVTNVAVALTLNFITAARILRDSVAATFFYANFHFAATSTDYFAQALGKLPSPVQHFWSLSVEEQFYFVWPSLVLGAFALAWWRSQRRIGAGGGRAAIAPEETRRRALLAIAVIVVVCFGGSLAYSIIDTHNNPLGAYFSTFARAWELALGAGIAVAAPTLRTIPSRARTVLAFAGLALIIVAATTFSSRTPFPGSAALLPTAGSALLIVAGIGTGAPIVGGLLGSAPMRYIGDRSYTFYLWHFPALVIAEQAAGHELPLATNLVLLLVAFGVSVVTYGLYENPLRHARWLSGMRVAVAVPALAGVAVLSVVIPRALSPSPTAPLAVPPLAPAAGQPAPTSLWHATPIPAVVRAVAAARAHAPVPVRLAPPLSSFETVDPVVHPGCTAKQQMVTSKLCPRGDTRSHRVLVLIGDSHAGMWAPALSIAATRMGDKLIALSHSGCELDRIDANTPRFPCKSWYQWALRTARRLHPVATIVAFRTGQYVGGRISFAVTRLRQVLTQVPRGVLIADPPLQRTDPPECLAASGSNLGRCSSSQRPSSIQLLHGVAKMAAEIHRPVLPTLQWFCADHLCPMVINHTVTRRDTSHVTGKYAHELGPLMTRELRAALSA